MLRGSLSTRHALPRHTQPGPPPQGGACRLRGIALSGRGPTKQYPYGNLVYLSDVREQDSICSITVNASLAKAARFMEASPSSLVRLPKWVC